MKKIVVASKNPVKVQAALSGFQQLFPEETFEVTGVAVPSGVNDQPMGNAETLQGATNRVNGAKEAEPTADYWVGIEGGLMEEGPDLVVFAWLVVKSTAQTGKSRTGTFALPPKAVQLIREGYELGHADDILFQKENSKQSSGSVGILTHKLVDRTAYYLQAMILALIPFRNPKLYPQ